jgi:hypothetical protein
MDPFNIPWKCLDHNSESSKTIPEPSKPQKTFAQAVNNICDIPLSQLPQPVVKGDRLAIEIPETFYLAGLEACKHNLHGRILWPKGSTPLSVAALKDKLSLIWKDLSQWGIISLGKGFFEFTFSSLEDVRRVRSYPSWNLNPGLLKLFAWSRDFNPKFQYNTSVQVWVRIYGLSQEYWQKNILFTIASSIRTPICIDSVTAKPMHERSFGQFVRVLVDIDLLQPLRYKLLVERKGYAFFVDLEYEHIPDFCHNCKVIGHNIDNCKRWNKEEEVKTSHENNTKRKPAPDPKSMFVQVNDGRPKQGRPKEIINVEEDVIQVEDNSEKNQQPSPNIVKDIAPEKDKEQLMVTDQPIVHVLSPKALLLAQDRQLEVELNAHAEPLFTHVLTPAAAASSNKDSFVSNTQVQPTPDVSSSKSIRDTPERVIKDMNFLKTSWANMVDDEENAQLCLEEAGYSESNHADGFQVVLSKAQKNTQKKKKQSSKDSYATRSKVTLKPFK